MKLTHDQKIPQFDFNKPVKSVWPRIWIAFVLGLMTSNSILSTVFEITFK